MRENAIVWARKSAGSITTGLFRRKYLEGNIMDEMKLTKFCFYLSLILEGNAGIKN